MREIKETFIQKDEESHLNSLLYFWTERGDLERYANFEKIKPMLAKRHPEILRAWYSYKDAKRTLTLLLESKRTSL